MNALLKKAFLKTTVLLLRRNFEYTTWNHDVLPGYPCYYLIPFAEKGEEANHPPTTFTGGQLLVPSVCFKQTAEYEIITVSHRRTPLIDVLRAQLLQKLEESLKCFKQKIFEM